MNLTNAKVLVIGMGKTGFSVAKKLAGSGIDVKVTDSSDNLIVRATAEKLQDISVPAFIGNKNASLLNGIDIVIPSPGVPNTTPIVSSAFEKGIEVISEIELAYRMMKKPRIIGITGTNGKTSTTLLIGRMLENSGMNVKVAGNIGYPLIDFVDDSKEDTLFVVELSSFQLENTSRFKPWIGAILNIAEDHIDWHGDIESYAKAKWKMFANQGSGDYAILNADDELTAETARQTGSVKLTFSQSGRTADYFIKDNCVYKNQNSGVSLVCSLEGYRYSGKHNLENALAAAAVSDTAAAEKEAIEQALRDFEIPAHRISLAGTVNGVRYYNDSKATNPHAAIAAIDTFEGEPLILMLGGKNKGNDFEELANKAVDSAKQILLFGDAAEEISTVFPTSSNIELCGNLAEAVKKAKSAARPGDVVLMTPGCASFDEFDDYTHRGRCFEELVNMDNSKNE